MPLTPYRGPVRKLLFYGLRAGRSPEFGGRSGPSRKVVEEATNIVMAPPRVDSPVTKPLRPKEGVPLAQPVDAKTIERRRQDKGLKPGGQGCRESLEMAASGAVVA